ncbi:MAG: class I SAM-dependent methyltransferase [Nitrospirae bacterium]|nr:class I SAM-dependent methyltransferase [Nitrospirota bacterium]
MLKLNSEWYAKDASNILVKFGEVISEMIKPASDSTMEILDVACGAGGNCALAMLRRFAEKTIKITAIDYNPFSVFELTNHVTNLVKTRKIDIDTIKAGICVELMDATNMGVYDDNHYDYITGSGALSNFYDPQAAMKEIYRILKDDGTLILGDFYVPEIAREYMQNLTAKDYSGRDDEYRPYIDYHDVVSLFERHGFSVLEYIPVRWAYRTDQYTNKDYFAEIPERIKNDYLELHERSDGQKAIVFNSFIVKAQKRIHAIRGKVYKFEDIPSSMHGSIEITLNKNGITVDNIVGNIMKLCSDDSIKMPPIPDGIEEITDIGNIDNDHFDIVTAKGVLNSLRDTAERQALISGINRILKDGGKLIISGFLNPSKFLDDNEHLDYYDVMRFLHKAKFSIEHYSPKTYYDYGFLDFTGAEFTERYSIKDLAESLKKNGFKTIVETVSDLNKLLTRHDLYTQLIENNKGLVPSQRLYGLKQIYEKTMPEKDNEKEKEKNLKMLNRVVLEEISPQCPKLNHYHCFLIVAKKADNADKKMPDALYFSSVSKKELSYQYALVASSKEIGAMHDVGEIWD